VNVNVAGPVPYTLVELFEDDSLTERYEGPASKRRKVGRDVSVAVAVPISGESEGDDVVEVERRGVMITEVEMCLVRLYGFLVL